MVSNDMSTRIFDLLVRNYFSYFQETQEEYLFAKIKKNIFNI